MKRCPRCDRTYTDNALVYCLDDGTHLSASDDPQATLALPQARPTDPFPQIAPPAQLAQPEIVRQGVRPAVVYVLVALLALVIGGGAVAFYYEREKSSTTVDANKQANIPAPSPTPTESGNKTQPTPGRTPERENVGGSVPGKYPEGSTRLLTYTDVTGKSAWDLKIMKNEIYARHGYLFKTPELKSYFERQSWYKPMYDDVSDLLNNIEKENAAFLKGYE
jgi:hypothetical protein